MASNHFEDGRALMVDIGAKVPSERRALAEAWLLLPPDAEAALDDNPKGDPVPVAELAGIMAAKRTSELIPLCHPLPLTSVRVEVERRGHRVRITAHCKTTARTGVEMEALTAAAVAALTLYDMLKGASKGIVIERVGLLEKDGGTSGPWRSSSDR